MYKYHVQQEIEAVPSLAHEPSTTGLLGDAKLGHLLAHRYALKRVIEREDEQVIFALSHTRQHNATQRNEKRTHSIQTNGRAVL